MRLFRKIAAASILLFAFGVAVFVVGKSAVVRSEQTLAELAHTVQDGRAGARLGESVPDSALFRGDIVQEINTAPRKNATEALAQKIAASLIERNPEGPFLLDGKNTIEAIRPDELIDQALADELRNFAPDSFIPLISITELKLAPQTDAQAVEAYIKKSQTILKNNFSQMSLDPNRASPRDFGAFAQALEKAIAEFYALPVPVNIADWHAEQIGLMTAQKNIFRAISAVENDPLAALLTLQAMPEVDERFAALTKKVNNFVSGNNPNP